MQTKSSAQSFRAYILVVSFRVAICGRRCWRGNFLSPPLKHICPELGTARRPVIYSQTLILNDIPGLASIVNCERSRCARCFPEILPFTLRADEV
jgi:hypothetical protein